VLEYLGVPHDAPTSAEPPPPPQDTADDRPAQEDQSDLQALFAEVNNLPADDPLRSPDSSQAAAVSSDGNSHGVSPTATVVPVPARTQVASNPTDSALHDAAPPEAALPPLPEKTADATPAAPSGRPESGTLVTDAKHRVAVPSFAGASVRQVVERAGTAGLAVQLLGNGLARDQAPAAGTMVPMGTEIIVRFAR
jgi:cell division protein FtsI (penicillin-binding protein 3)